MHFDEHSVQKEEKNIAICYFLKEEDRTNACELTDQRLVVRRQGKVTEFLLGRIRTLRIIHRKLLVPIIFSGVFTPLIAVGFFEGFFHPVLAAIFIITGIFTFYLGWLGRQVFTVEHDQGHMDFPLENPGQNLHAFIDFTNEYLEQVPAESRSFYAFRGPGSGMEHEHPVHFVPPVNLFSYQQMKEYLLENPGETAGMIWGIDPLKTRGQIRYEIQEGEGRLRPVMKDKIEREAVVSKYTIPEFLLTSRKK